MLKVISHLYFLKYHTHYTVIAFNCKIILPLSDLQNWGKSVVFLDIHFPITDLLSFKTMLLVAKSFPKNERVHRAHMASHPGVLCLVPSVPSTDY